MDKFFCSKLFYSKFFYLILLFILIQFFLDYNYEKYQNYQSLMNKNDQCCLIEKKLNKDGFYYKYSSSNCDINKILEHDKMKLISSDKMPMDMCNSNSSNLGSCRKSNHECIDFISKKNCSKVDNMIWSKLPCNMPIKFKNIVNPR